MFKFPNKNVVFIYIFLSLYFYSFNPLQYFRSSRVSKSLRKNVSCHYLHSPLLLYPFISFHYFKSSRDSFQVLYAIFQQTRTLSFNKTWIVVFTTKKVSMDGSFVWILPHTHICVTILSFPKQSIVNVYSMRIQLLANATALCATNSLYITRHPPPPFFFFKVYHEDFFF